MPRFEIAGKDIQGVQHSARQKTRAGDLADIVFLRQKKNNIRRHCRKIDN
jgi:hypothetical protein